MWKYINFNHLDGIMDSRPISRQYSTILLTMQVKIKKNVVRRFLFCCNFLCIIFVLAFSFSANIKNQHTNRKQNKGIFYNKAAEYHVKDSAKGELLVIFNIRELKRIKKIHKLCIQIIKRWNLFQFFYFMSLNFSPHMNVFTLEI